MDPSAQAPAAARKAALRREARVRRRARTARQRADDAAGLVAVVLAAAPLAAARRVALYCSTPDEPGTGPLREALRARGVEVLLPVVDGDVLDWALDEGAAVPGHRGVPEPSGRRLGVGALGTCDVALVPALAVDTAGRRLGQGGGHYDRALAAARPAGPVVALLHDGEVRDAARDPVPGLSHDARVDAVATPTRWLWTADGTG